jgi:hypothetical protein
MRVERRIWIVLIVLIATLVPFDATVSHVEAGAAATAKRLPNACTLISKTDVATAFAKLESALQPTSVSDPVRGKPSNQGGQGTNSCQTAFYLPNSVAGNVLVKTNLVTKQTPCPPKGQPGKTVTISGTKALLEPLPSDAKVVRDVTFVDHGGCAFIEIFLSGGSARVPRRAFVDLATAALAKKSGATAAGTSSTSASQGPPAACTTITKADAETALGQAVNDNDATSTTACEYRETSGPNFINVEVASGQTKTDLQRMLSNSGPLQFVPLGDAAYMGPVTIAVLKNGISIRIDWLGGATPNTPNALTQLARTASARI